MRDAIQNGRSEQNERNPFRTIIWYTVIRRRNLSSSTKKEVDLKWQKQGAKMYFD